MVLLPCEDEPELEPAPDDVSELLGDELLELGEELLGDELLPELLGEALPELELWLPCEELPELAPPFSAASVCWSSCPVCGRLCCCWNCLIAFSVFGPILPSTWPTSRPFCCRACCAWRMSELLADEEEDDCPPWLIEEVPWS